MDVALSYKRKGGGQLDLVAMRRRTGNTQAAIAKAAGIARAYYAQLEAGTRVPSVGVASRLAAALRVPIDEVIAAVKSQQAARSTGDEEPICLGKIGLTGSARL